MCFSLYYREENCIGTSRPPTTIGSHDLYACDIRGSVGEIASYQRKRLVLSPFLGPIGCASFGLSLGFPLCLPWDGSNLLSDFSSSS